MGSSINTRTKVRTTMSMYDQPKRQPRYPERLVGRTSKVCPGCQRDLALTRYGRDKRNSDGLHSRCRDCVNAYQRVRLDTQRTLIKQKKAELAAAPKPTQEELAAAMRPAMSLNQGASLWDWFAAMAPDKVNPPDESTS